MTIHRFCVILRSDRRHAWFMERPVIDIPATSKRLKEIREKRGLVYTVYSFANAHTQTGLFGIYAGTTADELNELIPVVSDEIKKVVNDKVKEEELRRAKMQLKASMLMALESSSSTAEVMARQQLIHGHIIETDEIIKRIDAVTVDGDC